MERDGFRHGFPPEAWKQAKVEARGILYAVAKKRGTIAYSHLVSQIHSIALDAYDTRLDNFLGEIAREDDDAGLGLTTVVVVHKTGDQLPGPGFFGMAESQGRRVDDPIEFWSNELNRVHDRWAGKK